MISVTSFYGAFCHVLSDFSRMGLMWLRWFLLNWKFLSRLNKLAPFQWWKFNKLDAAGRIQKAWDTFLCKEFILLQRMPSWQMCRRRTVISVTSSRTYCWVLKGSGLSAGLWIKSRRQQRTCALISWIETTQQPVFFCCPGFLILRINDFVNWTKCCCWEMPKVTTRLAVC